MSNDRPETCPLCSAGFVDDRYVVILGSRIKEHICSEPECRFPVRYWPAVAALKARIAELETELADTRRTIVKRLEAEAAQLAAVQPPATKEQT